ncbi:DUF6232 family protein [Allorhizocola rhizosphaerae]|uniref:DUF6232 family protein n=1 Tax=Allorhizocola rhizosphaerae TaxID=1872709 RepID=UPI000E3B99C9|nr:DUF6232 family protein [Allorhizocola rhizosphaerae]
MSANHLRHPETLHYRHNGVVVTSRYFAVGPARYNVSDLSDLSTAQGSNHPGVMAGVFAATGLLLVIVPMLIMHRFVALAVTVPMLLVAGLTSYVSARRWPAQKEIIVRYRGRLVTIFKTRDAREFGQVARALQRAVEAARPYGRALPGEPLSP